MKRYQRQIAYTANMVYVYKFHFQTDTPIDGEAEFETNLDGFKADVLELTMTSNDKPLDGTVILDDVVVRACTRVGGYKA